MRKNLSLFLFTLLAILIAGGSFVYAQDGAVTFQSTQFNVVEESEVARAILEGYTGDVSFITSDEGTLIDLLTAEGTAGEGSTDLIGALHGTFPSLVAEDLLFDLTEVATSIDAEHDIADAFLTLGKMGTQDYQYYVPWMQATFIMGANDAALAYLPEGVDINALTWVELADWCAAIAAGEGENKCGLPVAGLFHRFMEGYIYPSYTGAMVTKFNSPEAVEMFEFLRDTLWPLMNAESVNYEFMNEPLLSGEVWVAFDHTARLKPAYDAMVAGETDYTFIAFPAPAGPAGRGFMPVVVGLGVPFTAPNPDAAESLIEFMLNPGTQGQVLADLGFFPVVSGVDTTAMPESVAIESAAVLAQASSPDALPALLPVGLGDRGGEINEIYRAAFSRIVFDGEDIQTVLDEEGTRLNTLLEETGAACWPPDAPSEGACQVE